MSIYKSRAKPAVKAASRRERLPAELSRVNFGAAGVDVKGGVKVDHAGGLTS